MRAKRNGCIMDDKAYEPPAFTEHFKAMPPGTLYHYTGQAGLLGIVESKSCGPPKSST